MARILGASGCLSQLVEILRVQGFQHLRSTAEIDSLRREFSKQKHGILARVRTDLENEMRLLQEKIEKLSGELEEGVRMQRMKLEEERNHLGTRIESYRKAPPTTLMAKIWGYLEDSANKRRFTILLHRLEQEAKRPFLNLQNLLTTEQRKAHTLGAQREELIASRVAAEFRDAERLAALIRDNKSLYLGACGEEKAICELSRLPNEFHVVNDFRCSFQPPIYRRETNDHIMSVQCDHIVVGPTGLFIIETKNWSAQSVSDASLRSPVEQIVRSNYALFVFLNRALRNAAVPGFSRHAWGARKLSPRNVVLLLRNRPNLAFQWVTLVSLEEVVPFILKGPQVLSPLEASSLADFLANTTTKTV